MYDELNIYNINSIFNFITKNYIQIFLLILVFIIIYIVDHISNINAVIFGLPSPIPNASQQQQQMQTKNQQPQKQKTQKLQKIQKQEKLFKNKNIKK